MKELPGRYMLLGVVILSFDGRWWGSTVHLIQLGATDSRLKGSTNYCRGPWASSRFLHEIVDASNLLKLLRFSWPSSLSNCHVSLFLGSTPMGDSHGTQNASWRYINHEPNGKHGASSSRHWRFYQWMWSQHTGLFPCDEGRGCQDPGMRKGIPQWLRKIVSHHVLATCGFLNHYCITVSMELILVETWTQDVLVRLLDVFSAMPVWAIFSGTNSVQWVVVIFAQTLVRLLDELEYHEREVKRFKSAAQGLGEGLGPARQATRESSSERESAAWADLDSGVKICWAQLNFEFEWSCAKCIRVSEGYCGCHFWQNHSLLFAISDGDWGHCAWAAADSMCCWAKMALLTHSNRES